MYTFFTLIIQIVKIRKEKTTALTRYACFVDIQYYEQKIIRKTKQIQHNTKQNIPPPKSICGFENHCS